MSAVRRRLGFPLVLLLALTAGLAAAPAPTTPAAPHFKHPLRMVAPAPGAAGAAAAGTPGPVGYIPCDVAHAYGLNPLGLDGSGVTIAIVVASDEPNLQIDLHGFDTNFGLGDPRFAVFAPFGHTAQVDPSWPAEIALDVEWAHAAAPGAVIDVVEAATDQFQNPPSSDLLATTAWAVKNLSPDVVVLPWGAAESVFAQFYGSGFEAQFNTQIFPPTNGAGRPVTYLAPAGGNGFETDWPAVATTVVGVGGTSLAPQAFGYSSMPGGHLDCSGTGASYGVNQTNETVWGSAACTQSPCTGTGGGASAFEAKPAWQAGQGPGSNRLEPDVAMLADPRTGVATYQNGQFNQSLLGGTGLSASLWAGVVATMDQEEALHGGQGLSVSSASSWVYFGAKAADFNDITSGASPAVPNDPCLTSGACVAQAGYDQVTGRGSPHVFSLVADLGLPPAPPPGSPDAPDVIADSSGNGNLATWTGGITFGAPGLVSGDGDTAMNFDGASGAVNTSLVNQGWSQLTVEAWFRLSSLPPNSRPRIVANSHTDVDFKGFQLEIDPNSGTGFVDVGTGSTHVVAPWTQAVTVGTTYHYVLTYDGATIRAYLNGAQVGTGAGSGAVVASPLPVTIGRNPAYTVSDFVPGTVDEVAIYDHALTTARVQAHLTAGLGYRNAVLPDTPIAYYRLDDRSSSIRDSSGHANSAAWNGGVTFGAPGLVSGDRKTAMSFDGSSGYVNTSLVNQVWTQLTVEAWFRMASPILSTRPRIVANSHTDVDFKGFQLEIDPSTGTGFADVGTGSTHVVAPWTQTLTAGTSYHYMLTYDGATIRAYLNGAQVGSGTGSGAVAASPLPVEIARNPAYATDFLAGTVDEVAIYDHALTSARVQAHLTAGSDYRGAVLTDSPSAYYRLDDRSGSIADSSGFANPASWTGGVTFGQPGLVSGDGDTAMSFDGSTGSVNTSLVNQAWAQLTVEAWFRLPSPIPSTRPRIVANSHTDVDFKGFQLEIDPSTGTGFADVGTGSTHVVAPWTQTLIAGTSFHYVLTYDGATIRAYLNGAQVGSGTGSGAVAASPLPVEIARNPAYATDFLAGTVDEVAIYDHALTSARVQAHLTAGSGYRSAVLADNPTAYYRLDDRSSSIADSSGHGSSAAWNGGVSFGTKGLVSGDGDTAMSFDGATGAVSTPLVNRGWSQLTVECWFRLSGLPTTRPRIVANSHTDVDFKGFQLEIDPSNGTGFVDVGTGSAHVVAPWTQPLTAGTPYHYVLTYDGTTIKAYLNGALVGSGTGSGTVVASSLPVQIARNPAYDTDFLAGTVDEVAIYDHALTVDRVQAHLTAGSGYRAAVLIDSPIAYYRLDDMGGQQ